METAETPGAGSKRAIYWIVSLTLAGVFLYYSLRGIEWEQVWATLKSARVPVVIFTLILMTGTLFLRAFRWRVILQAEARVGIPLAFWATAAGYLGNNVLPARAGEVVRSLMISSKTGMSKAFVLTTALAERVVDAIAVITISSIVLLTMQNRPGWLAGAARPFAILGICGVLGIILIPAFEVFWFKVLGLVPLSPRLRSQVEGILNSGLQGIRSFHDFGRLSRFVILTAVIWTMDAVTTVILAQSIHLQILLPTAFLLTAGLALGSALPSTPGYVGVYQIVAVSILPPFGISRAASIAYILMFQAINYAVVLFWGGIGFSQKGQPVKTLPA